jgi:hypothetical protein
MAETTRTTPSTAATTRGGSNRSTPATKSTATARRQSAATRRSTAGKRAAATRASNRTQAQARRATQGPRTRVEQLQGYAERGVLVQIGAALEARDRVLSTVNQLVELSTSRTQAERQLKRFERRGSTARTRAQREVRKARTRVERELRQRQARVERTLRRNQQRIERELQSAQRDAEREGKSLRENVAANVDLAAAQVENAVQTGITAGAKVVAKASDRAASQA